MVKLGVWNNWDVCEETKDTWYLNFKLYIDTFNKQAEPWSYFQLSTWVVSTDVLRMGYCDQQTSTNVWSSPTFVNAAVRTWWAVSAVHVPTATDWVMEGAVLVSWDQPDLWICQNLLASFYLYWNSGSLSVMIIWWIGTTTLMVIWCIGAMTVCNGNLMCWV